MTDSCCPTTATTSPGRPTPWRRSPRTACRRSCSCGRPPTRSCARFGHCRAIGLAGTSRSEAPDWMDEHLTPAFAWLKSLGAALCHYKVCSTFDSSPDVGSIGRAIDIGQRGVRRAPRAPRRRRAAAQALHRLRQSLRRLPGRDLPHRPSSGDEPPSGDAHGRGRYPPPPRQADERRPSGSSISGRSQRPTPSAEVDRALERRATRSSLLDVADRATQAVVGRQLWRLREQGAPFVVGSSGVEYALVAEWLRHRRDVGARGLRLARAGRPHRRRLRQLLADHGAPDPPGGRGRLRPRRGRPAPPRWARTRERAIDEAVARRAAQASKPAAASFSTRRSARRPMWAPRSTADPAAATPSARVSARSCAPLVERQGLTRAVIAGGDTSSHALRPARRHGVDDAAAAAGNARLAPVHAPIATEPAFDGLEIALKGGQLGGDGYFSRIRDGARVGLRSGPAPARGRRSGRPRARCRPKCG